ncbi:MAG: redoxin domain-containing protein [Methanomassiliicoccales archaeon]
MKAPDFSLTQDDEETFRLEEELGRNPVILLFYPSDFGIICSIEMREFHEMCGRLEELGIRVVGVSIDHTRTHRAWKQKLRIPFRLLADEEGEVSRLYGVYLEEEMGMLKRMANRAVFLIDQEGTIRYRWVAPEPATSPDMEEVGEAVERL